MPFTEHPDLKMAPRARPELGPVARFNLQELCQHPGLRLFITTNNSHYMLRADDKEKYTLRIYKQKLTFKGIELEDYTPGGKMDDLDIKRKLIYQGFFLMGGSPYELAKGQSIQFYVGDIDSEEKRLPQRYTTPVKSMLLFWMAPNEKNNPPETGGSDDK